MKEDEVRRGKGRHCEASRGKERHSAHCIAEHHVGFQYRFGDALDPPLWKFPNKALSLGDLRPVQCPPWATTGPASFQTFPCLPPSPQAPHVSARAAPVHANTFALCFLLFAPRPDRQGEWRGVRGRGEGTAACRVGTLPRQLTPPNFSSKLRRPSVTAALLFSLSALMYESNAAQVSLHSTCCIPRTPFSCQEKEQGPQTNVHLQKRKDECVRGHSPALAAGLRAWQFCAELPSRLIWGKTIRKEKFRTPQAGEDAPAACPRVCRPSSPLSIPGTGRPAES